MFLVSQNFEVKYLKTPIRTFLILSDDLLGNVECMPLYSIAVCW